MSVQYINIIYVMSVPFWLETIKGDWQINEKDNPVILEWLKNSLLYLSTFYILTFIRSLFIDCLPTRIVDRIPERTRFRTKCLYESMIICGSFFIGFQSLLGIIKYGYMINPKDSMLKTLCLCQIFLMAANGIAFWIFIAIIILVVILCCLQKFGIGHDLENRLQEGFIQRLVDGISGNEDQNNMTTDDLEKLKTHKQILDESILDEFVKSNQATCSICIKEYAIEEEVQVQPVCKHNFHYECVISWFEQKFECPMCRSKVKDQLCVQTRSELTNQNNIEVMECNTNINDETIDTIQERILDEEA